LKRFLAGRRDGEIDRAQEAAIDVADIGLELPERFRHLLVQLDRGELTVTSRLEVPLEVSRRFEQAVNRLAVSVVAAGSTIGLSILASIHRPSGPDGIGLFVLRASLALSIACSVWLLGAFWRSKR
jgi:hypothetical protein